MRVMRWLTGLLFLLGLSPVWAAPSPLTFTGSSTETVKASEVSVPIFKEAELSGLKPIKLYLTGKGLREKQIAFFNANVYILLSYVDDARVASLAGNASVGLEEHLKKIFECKTRVLEFHFVRDVGPDKIRDAFKESLKDNGISTAEGSPAAKFLDQFQTEMKKGQVMTLVATAEGLKLDLPNQKIEAAGGEVANDFWKIWFGRTREGAIQKLQLQLLGRAPFPK